MINSQKWIVSQLGGRQHYAVPRGFERLGILKRLYTDVWCRLGRELLRNGPAGARSLASRFHADIPGSKVTAQNSKTILRHLTESLRHHMFGSSVANRYLEYIDIGQSFATFVRDSLRESGVNPESDVFFGFNTGSLECLEYLAEQRMPTIVDQIDPARVEDRLVREERRLWPGWEVSGPDVPEEYWARLAREWELADLVLVNSSWTKSALEDQGVPERKILVLPIAYDPPIAVKPKNAVGSGPLIVIWIGMVCLRKGIQYLLQAARLLSKSNIRFIIGGDIWISPDAITSAPSNVEFLGRVTRDQVTALYRKADVFVLPTLSDGFAITQIEAMAHGLPVIATPNCGEVVQTGMNGLIVPIRDAEAIANALNLLDSDRELTAEMSRQAIRLSTAFRLPRQAAALSMQVDAFRRNAC